MPNQQSDIQYPGLLEERPMSVPEFCEVARCGKTFAYQQMNSGALRAVKVGRRTLILPKDYRRWQDNLKPYQKGARHD
jgi:hypothetical protein